MPWRLGFAAAWQIRRRLHAACSGSSPWLAMSHSGTADAPLPCARQQQLAGLCTVFCPDIPPSRCIFEAAGVGVFVSPEKSRQRLLFYEAAAVM